MLGVLVFSGPVELRVGLYRLAVDAPPLGDGFVLRQVGFFDLGVERAFRTGARLGFERCAIGTGSGDECSGEDRGEVGAVGVRVCPKESTERGLGLECFDRDANERSGARGREEVGNLRDVGVGRRDARGAVVRHWIDP